MNHGDDGDGRVLKRAVDCHPNLRRSIVGPVSVLSAAFHSPSSKMLT